MKRTYTLIIEGNNENAFDDALKETTRLMVEGFLAGVGSNDEGSFFFESERA